MNAHRSTRGLLAALALAAAGVVLPAPPAAAAVVNIVGTPGPDVVVVDDLAGFWTINGGPPNFFVGPDPNVFTITTLDRDDVVQIRDGLNNDQYTVRTGQGNDSVTLVDHLGTDNYNVDTGRFAADEPVAGLCNDTVHITDGPNDFRTQQYFVATGPCRDRVRVVDSALAQPAAGIADVYGVLLDTSGAMEDDDYVYVEDAAGLDAYRLDALRHVVRDVADLVDSSVDGDSASVLNFEIVNGAIV